MNKIEPSYNKDRQILGEILPLDTPFTVGFDVSEQCNFKCRYCFRSSKPSENWSYAKNNDLMTMETFDIAVNQLLEFPAQVKRIAFSNNGEPLCNKDLPKMIKRIKNLKLTGKTEIHTNASLLTLEYINELVDSNIDKIIISIQGLCTDDYKKTCGVAIDFENFCKNIKYLYDNKNKNCEINIKIIDTALSKKEDEETFYKIFSDMSDKLFIEKEVPLFKQIKYSDYGKDKPVNKYGQKFQNINYCQVIFYTLYVSPNGNIYPCQGIPPPLDFGNIKNTTLFQAWNGSRRINYLKEQLQKTRQLQANCCNCYVPQNSVKTEADIIDSYKDEILGRLK